MLTLQSSSFLSPSSSFYSPSYCKRRLSKEKFNIPNIQKLQTSKISLPRLQMRRRRSIQEQHLINGYTNRIDQQLILSTSIDVNNIPDPLNIAKLYAIKEAIADRVQMHKNIGEQRSQWNNMLLTSINNITLAAATMTAIATTSTSPFLGLKMSSTLMYLAATGMLVIMNQLQPSQLAEEQRIAARLFQDLLNQIDTTLSIGHPITSDVKEAMEKVLALDKAYPLPLLGTMLEKFPSSVEPAVWWPQHRRRQARKMTNICNGNDWNGWNGKLEDEMKEIMGVLERKDQEDYIRLGKKALKFNKFLAISGTLLTSLGAIGSAFVGSSHIGYLASMIGVVAGALASIVNTIEHGGQVGTIFEIYRSTAGFYKYMQESIESNLTEADVERRENGEVFEMKVALKLGRSLTELRDLADASSCKGEQLDEFASKLF